MPHRPRLFVKGGREQSRPATLGYHYYSTGKVESIQSSNTNGVNVSYTYDGLNRLSTVVDNRLSSSNTTSYTYDNASNVVTVAYPNGVTSTITYDELNRITELSTSASGTQIADYKYTLGLTGNRTNATEKSGRTLQWGYNGIYQLNNENITGDPANNGSATYTLDPVGNRTAATSTFSGFTPVFGSYNLNDQLSGETYDNNGNVTGTTNGNSYVYDSENHMIQMVKGTTTIGMKYDAFGNRVSKAVTTAGVTTTTQYLVDDLNPTGYTQVLDELTGPIGSAAVQRTYTYGLQRISQDQYVSNAWLLSYYQYDGGGSVRQLTNSVGAVTDSYEYDAFGNSFTKQGTTPNNYLYRGEQFDSDLGLYYLRARYYNPATGRFMSRDPEDHDLTDPGKLHKYLYSHGDPINWRDPTGRDDEDEDVFLVTLNTTVRNSTGVYRLVRTACMFEVMYAGIAEVTKAAAKYFWGRKEGPLPEPPLWLDAACIVVLGKAQLLDLWDHVLELSALY